MLNAKRMLGTHDVVMITLDTLRFDVAQREFEAGRLPVLSQHLEDGWEKRHTPGNFTFSAHAAFFSGFLPTPASPGPHPRLFALAFPGAETIGDKTLVLDAPNLVEGFASHGYRTLCAGGTGFFNLRSPLGRVMPGYFQRAQWRESFGVTDPESTEHQVAWLLEELAALSQGERAFLFLNVSALHQPNYFYQNPEDPQRADTLESHAAALRYVDGALEPLFLALEKRSPTLVVIFSDHGTAYGEDGYRGHRLNHWTVGDVPYGEFVLGAQP
jgi:predicted AlkP superfamily pyrophosphatase or phosphodiesterase